MFAAGLLISPFLYVFNICPFCMFPHQTQKTFIDFLSFFSSNKVLALFIHSTV